MEGVGKGEAVIDKEATGFVVSGIVVDEIAVAPTVDGEAIGQSRGVDGEVFFDDKFAFGQSDGSTVEGGIEGDGGVWRGVVDGFAQGNIRRRGERGHAVVFVVEIGDNCLSREGNEGG